MPAAILTTPASQAVRARILESITDAFFALSPDWHFTYFNERAQELLQRPRGDLLGKNVWEEFPAALGSNFERNYRRAMAESVPVTFEEYYPEPLNTWFEVRAYPSEGGLAVYFHNITARKRGEESLRQSEERYRLLLDSTGDGIYGLDDQGCFTFVNRAAERILGFTQPQTIGQNSHALIHHTRADGRPYPSEECPIYHALRSGQSVQVEDDVFWRSDGTFFPVAYTVAPIFQQEKDRGSVVTFLDISERKALAGERERLAERERNIAQQLQAALTPTIPRRIPGMVLAHYYEATLDEAGVGGDFYDVFPLEEGCTALIVGDLTGKGLAAASQVATVRNMLRYALYRAQTLRGALTSLNALLAEQELLTGFATLFIGAYDSSAGTLTYVNCGQEPALVRRASGAVDLLLPTGPILGTLTGVSFEEQATVLELKDTLAIFTDGLTEVGPSRTEMLGIEGIIDFLSQPLLGEADIAEVQVQHIVQRLIVGVDAAARGGVMRDDMCLLVGIVE